MSACDLPGRRLAPTTLAALLVALGAMAGGAVAQEPAEDPNGRPADAPPTIEIRSPANGAIFERGEVVLADYTCAHDSGIRTCWGSAAVGQPIPTAGLGERQFRVDVETVSGIRQRLVHTYTLVRPGERPPPPEPVPPEPEPAPVPPPLVVNPGPPASVPAPVPAPAPAQAPTTPAPAPVAKKRVLTLPSLKPLLRNVRLLRPRAGAKVRVTRPMLRWRGRRRVAFYNLQIFRLSPDGSRFRKVHSAFPRRPRYRLPRRVLRRNGVFVWRVWPRMQRKGFSPKPLGVSYFALSRRARR